MKIIVVSDTHKDFNALNTVVENNLDADLIIHLGDGENEARDIQNIHPELPMIYVQGNCDFGTYDPVKIVTACGFKIFCTHGHMHLINGQLDKLIADAKQNDCRIVLYGHTHIHRVLKIDGVYVMNPGSLKSPRNQNERTYGLIEITTENEIKMNIIAPEL